MKWFEITEEAKNQIEKLLAKQPDKYAVSLMVEGAGVQDSNTSGDS